MTPLWYDKAGKVIGNTGDYLIWREKHFDNDAEKEDEYRIVGRDSVEGYLVSTVWLGLNHNYSQGRPILFETMVFGEGDWAYYICERYETEQEAISGHAAIVERVVQRLREGDQKVAVDE